MSRFLIPCLLLAVLVLVLAHVALGPSSVSTSGFDPLASLGGLFAQAGEAQAVIAREIRLPRALVALGVGFALGLSGAALQGLLRNPLADPGVLGVSAAAALGAVSMLYFGLAAVSVWLVPFGALIGAFAATALLFVIGVRQAEAQTLILVGVGISSLAGGLIALVMNLAPTPFSLSDIVNWSLGSVANRGWTDLIVFGPFALAGCALILLARAGLSALTLGEETAASLGAPVRRTQALVVIGSAAAVGAATAAAGVIGFVGLVAPHLVRGLVGHDPARTLIPSGLVGGALVLAADLIVRLAPFQQELRLGVAAALFGAPAFILIAARMGRRT
jgi:iron complex transport system permease protein